MNRAVAVISSEQRAHFFPWRSKRFFLQKLSLVFEICTSPHSVPRGVHNMLTVRVYAAHIGLFLGLTFSKQGSLFPQIFLRNGWVILKLANNSQKLVVFRQNSS